MGLISETKKAMRDSPREIFNAYVFSVHEVLPFQEWPKVSTKVNFSNNAFEQAMPNSSLTGKIASLVVQDRFKHDFGVSNQPLGEYANTKGWIVSIATAGAVFGCLGCTYFNDRFGRRWALRGGTIVYIAGILGQGLCNGNLNGLYASRFVAGLGIGATTVVPPLYISEIAPKAIRGLLTLQYAACQQLGVVFGFFINFGVTKSYAGIRTQWMLRTLLQVLPAAVWGASTFCVPESPRWLLSKSRRGEAAKNLCKLRNLPAGHPVIGAELAGMDAQLEHEIEAVAGASQIDLLLETFVPVENRRRFFLIFMTTLFSQWSGANAITQYSPTIFGYLGVTGTESQFLATGIYGVVKFASCLAFALLVVDFLGRRRSLMTGIVLQILTLAYVGAYLGITGGMSTAAVEDSRAASHAGTAAIVAIYIHAVAWSIGWFSMPYLVGAEIFPTRIRSLNMSLSMAFHWAFCFGSSRSMPSLLAATHKWGAFVFFGCICLISLVYVFVAMPDTTGRSLESLDGLFQRPWYTVFKVAYPSPGEMRIEGRNTKVLEDPPKGGLENTKIGEAERIEDISRG